MQQPRSKRGKKSGCYFDCQLSRRTVLGPLEKLAGGRAQRVGATPTGRAPRLGPSARGPRRRAAPGAHDAPPRGADAPPRSRWFGTKNTRRQENVTTFAPHGGRAAPLAAGARLIAAPTPRRRHLARRGAALRRRQNGRELAARPRQQKHERLLLLLFSSRLVAGAHARDVRPCRRVRSAKPKDDSNREPVGAAAARGGKTHDAHLIEMLLLWHLLI